MSKTKRERQKIKRRRLSNKRLCKRYPWLKSDTNVWNGKKDRNYKYDWTYFDDIPDGWRRAFGMMMIDEMDAELKRSGRLKYQNDPWNRWSIQQIKSKYGTLRFYHSGASREFEEIINKYETISEHTCEFCGKPNTSVRDDGWVACECFDCFRKRIRRREKWANEHNMSFKSTSNEDLKREYDRFIVDDSPISDTYAYTRYSNGQEQRFEFDISDTVRRIEKKYENKMAKSQRRSARRLSKMG